MKRTSKPKRKPLASRAPRKKGTAVAVLDAIECITTVPRGALDVTVHQGWVRLEGSLPDWSQKETVDEIVRRLPGVKGLVSLIRVESR